MTGEFRIEQISISQELVKSAESQASVDVKRFMYLWKDFKAKVEDEDEDEEEIKSAFRAYDINGDGYITKDEMVQVSYAWSTHRPY